MNEPPTPAHGPLLIAIGGFAGTGKTAVSKRLSADFRIPRLSSDTIGHTIKDSAATKGNDIDAYWLAYELLFKLCEDFIQSGISVILDLSLGWPFHWQKLDGILERHPSSIFLPIIFRCPREQCIERIRSRHQARSDHYDPPHVYTSDQKHLDIWRFLQELNRPEAYFVDATGPEDDVYEAVHRHVIENGS